MHWYSSIIGTWFHPTCFSLYPTGTPYCHIPLKGTLHLLSHFRAPADFRNLLGFSCLPRSRTFSAWRIEAVPSLAGRACRARAALSPPVPVPAGRAALRYLPSAHKVVAQHQSNVNTGLAWAPAPLPDTPLLLEKCGQFSSFCLLSN